MIPQKFRIIVFSIYVLQKINELGFVPGDHRCVIIIFIMGIVALVSGCLDFHYEEYFFIQSEKAIACQEKHRFFCVKF